MLIWGLVRHWRVAVHGGLVIALVLCAQFLPCLPPSFLLVSRGLSTLFRIFSYLDEISR